VLLRQFPWALPILKSIPLSFLRTLNPPVANLVELGMVVLQKVAKMLKDNLKGKAEGTIFQTMMVFVP
jgi:hypothetical protein